MLSTKSSTSSNAAPAVQKFTGTPTFFWEVKSGLFAFDKLMETAVSVSKERSLELVVLGMNDKTNDLPKAIEYTERLITESDVKLKRCNELETKLLESKNKHSLSELSFTPKMIEDFERVKGDELGRNIQLTNLQNHIQSKSKKRVRLPLEVVERLVNDFAELTNLNRHHLQTLRDQKAKELAFFNALAASGVSYKFISELSDGVELSGNQKLIVSANTSVEQAAKYAIGKPIDLLAYKLHGEEVETEKSNFAMRIDLSKVPAATFGKVFAHTVAEVQLCNYETTKPLPKPISNLNYYLTGGQFQVRQFHSKRDDAIVPFSGGGDVIPAGKGTVGLATTLLAKHNVAFHEALINGARHIVIRNINMPEVQGRVAQVYNEIYSGQPSMVSNLFGR